MKIKWTRWIWVYVLWIITTALGFLCMLSTRSFTVFLIYFFPTNMWVASFNVSDFRCLGSLTLDFRKGLNILVGENTCGPVATTLTI